MKVMKIATILMMISCVSVSAIAQETIRLASGEWPPYQSEHLKYNGVASRIVTEAFALAGVRVEYGYFPWARSLENAKTGEWDGTFLWFDTPERRKTFHISKPVLDIQYVFFHLRSEPFDWKNMGDLKGIFIGATIKYDYGKAFQSAEAAGTIKVERAPNDKVNFKKLLEGRIRIFPNDLDAGYEIINRYFTPEQARLFTYHKKPVKSAPHHLLFSKRIGLNSTGSNGSVIPAGQKNAEVAEDAEGRPAESLRFSASSAFKKRLQTTKPVRISNSTMVERFNKGLRQLKASGRIDQYLTESRRKM